MPFLIDGHNLVPKVGLHLDAADDEHELIRILQEFVRQGGKPIEVYFDGAPAGNAGSKRYGRVTAHFVSERSSADAAIERRLAALKGEARNWIVVSSDARVLAAARRAQAGMQTSEEFARHLKAFAQRGRGASQGEPGRKDEGLSEVELNHWLEVFKKR